MPRITQYINTETLSAKSLEGAARGAQRLGNVKASTIQGVFGAAQGVISTLESHIADSEISSLSRSITEYDIETTKAYEEARQNADPNNPEFAADFVEKTMPGFEALGENLKTKRGQEVFERSRNVFQENLFNRAIADQSNLAATYQLSNFREISLARANESRIDPSMVATNAMQLEIAAESLPPEVRLKVLPVAISMSYESSAEGYLQQVLKNPQSTTEDFDKLKSFIVDPANGYSTHVGANRFSQILTSIDAAKLNRQQSVVQEWELAWPDTLRRIQETGDNKFISDAKESINNLSEGNPVATANKQLRWKRQLDDAATVGKVAEIVSGLPAPEVKMLYADIQNAIEDAPPEKLSELYAARDTLQTVIQNRDEAFFKDPAGYVVRAAPSVAAAYSELVENQTPEAFRAYAVASAGEQARLYPGFTPKLMTPEIEGVISKALSGVARDEKGAVEASRVLASWAQVTGPYWPQVAHELFDDKVLNYSQYVAASAYSRPQAQTLVEDILKAGTLSPENLTKLHGISRSEAEEKARKTVSDLAETLANAPNGAQLSIAYVDVLADLAQYRGDLSDIDEYAEKLINSEYTFSDSLRIPRNMGLDEGKIEKARGAILDNLDKLDIVIPPSFSGLGSADQKYNYLSQLSDSAQWFTNGDGTGVILYDEGGHNVKQIVNGRQVDVEYTWAEFEKIGAENFNAWDDLKRFFLGYEPDEEAMEKAKTDLSKLPYPRN